MARRAGPLGSTPRASFRLQPATTVTLPRKISRRCGQITVEVEGSSRSFGMWGSNASSRMSRSVSYQKRPLILEHEVMQNVRTDEQIIFMLNQPPLRCGRAIYFRRPEMNAVVGQNRFAR